MMRLARLAPLLAVLLLPKSGAGDEPLRSFRLSPGDYRWVPFTVKQVPTEVDCRFQVVDGDPTVHVELLPMSEFRLFNRGREYNTLAVSPDAASGAFRRIIEDRGQYAVVVINAGRAKPATVTLNLATDLNPSADAVAQELPPRRRLLVICVSFVVFFILVGFSGLRLLRALPRSRV